MSYPSLNNDMKWLLFLVELSQRLTDMIGGNNDAVLVDRGKLLMVVNVDPFRAVSCWYTPVENATVLGVDGVAKRFSDHVKELRRNQQ